MTRQTCITYGIIEDDPFWQAKLTELLTPSGIWDCKFCYPSFEAFILAGEFQVDIQFLLLDNQLPGLSGEQCLRLFRKLLPDHTKILIVSAHDDFLSLNNAILQDIDGYIVKSDLNSGLGDQLLSILNAGVLLSPDAASKLIQKIRDDNTPFMEDGLLSPKEWQILNRLSKGDTYEQAAKNLRIPLNTFRYYIKKLYKTIHVETSTGAVSWYHERINSRQKFAKGNKP